MSVIYGGDGDDELFGTDDDDVIVGFAGSDILFGGDGNDTLVGWQGNDYLRGGGGNDLFRGGTGADFLYGDSGIDTAEYGASRSGVIVNLSTGTGSSGDAQGDHLFGIENVSGSAYADALIGNDAANMLDGWVGNDLLAGGGGADRLIGNAGDDVLVGGAGGDRLDGGDGRDLVDYAASTIGVYVDLAYGVGYDGDAEGDTLSGVESVSGSAFGDSLIGNDGNNELWGNAGGDYLRGYGATDYLNGGDGLDYLLGDGDNDTLIGGNGDDILVGGVGADGMHGGRGWDTYYVDNAGDLLSESVGEIGGSDGRDLVYSSISFSLAPSATVLGDVENLTLTGTANINATGNTLANVLVGNSGDNLLIGGAGGDLMRGGAGYDVYYVDSAHDVVDEGLPGSNGIDRVQSSISFDLRGGSAVHGQVENLTLMGGANLRGTGNALGNIIVGNAGANTLDGLGGNDWLIGGAGRDTFVFDSPLNEDMNVDRISDFTVLRDSIKLSHAVMGRLTGVAVDPSGVLAADAFHAGAAAHDASDRIIYNPSNGWLSYDADGIGVAAPIHFATVSAHLAIAHDDFFVV